MPGIRVIHSVYDVLHICGPRGVHAWNIRRQVSQLDTVNVIPKVGESQPKVDAELEQAHAARTQEEYADIVR